LIPRRGQPSIIKEKKDAPRVYWGGPGRQDDHLARVSVFDGQQHVGDILQGADGLFDAVTADGVLIGRYTTRAQAMAAIPRAPS
jgi:hypothetical protein